jgi:hypothetical protein
MTKCLVWRISIIPYKFPENSCPVWVLRFTQCLHSVMASLTRHRACVCCLLLIIYYTRLHCFSQAISTNKGHGSSYTWTRPVHRSRAVKSKRGYTARPGSNFRNSVPTPVPSFHSASPKILRLFARLPSRLPTFHTFHLAALYRPSLNRSESQLRRPAGRSLAVLALCLPPLR